MRITRKFIILVISQIIKTMAFYYRKAFAVLSACFACVFSGCSSGGSRAVYLKTVDSVTDYPQFRFYHVSEDTTRVYFCVPAKYVVCMRNPDTMLFEGRASMNCTFYDGQQPSRSLFGASSTLEVKQEKLPEDAFRGHFDVPLKEGTYYVKTVFRDSKSKGAVSGIIHVDKKSRSAPANFLMRNGQQRVIFGDYVASGDTLNVFSVLGNRGRLFFSRYNSQVKYPLPAYITGGDDEERFEKDTTFSVANGENVVFSPPGLYVVRTDTSAGGNRGYGLLASYAGFPRISQKHALVPPLRYLCSDAEFDRLQYSPAGKLSAEEFWLSAAGSMSKAEKLIRAYYGRCEYANMYFSCYKEGVKTDRGMIYILFGQPVKVYTSSRSERWVYGRETSAMPVDFVFNRMDNPFSDNVYVLDRNINKKTIWAAAVDAWRGGKAFDNNEIARIQDEYDRKIYYDSYGIWY